MPLFAEHADALRGALTDVAENSFFAFVVLADAEQFAGAAAGAVSPWVTSTVPFDGPFSGMLELTLTRTLADMLIGGFVGLDPERAVGDAEMADGIGEFTNMVCGNWLTRECERAVFSLAVPQVQTMPAGWVPPPSGVASGESGEVFASVNDVPVRVHVQFVPSRQ